MMVRIRLCPLPLSGVFEETRVAYYVKAGKLFVCVPEGPLSKHKVSKWIDLHQGKVDLNQNFHSSPASCTFPEQACIRMSL